MKPASYLLGALCAIALTTATAQNRPPAISAGVEPDSIGIGERFVFRIDIDRDLMQAVEFPVFRSDPASGLELVESLPVDTLSREGRRVRLRKRYLLQAFEEGRFALGRGEALYADKNIVDTLRTEDTLYLYVGTFAIDSTSQSIFDLKPQRTLPFKTGEIGGYLAWALLALALLVAAALLLRRYLRGRGQGLGRLFHSAPPLPPHEAAIRALEALHNQKLWQNNRHKQYYSGLTDILRTYIAARYGIGAMEMTSDEILAAMRREQLSTKINADLTAILRDADLVKFAKAVPDADQNEADYYRAYYFVEETKPPTEPEADAQAAPEPSQSPSGTDRQPAADANDRAHDSKKPTHDA